MFLRFHLFVSQCTFWCSIFYWALYPAFVCRSLACAFLLHFTYYTLFERRCCCIRRRRLHSPPRENSI